VGLILHQKVIGQGHVARTSLSLCHRHTLSHEHMPLSADLMAPALDRTKAYSILSTFLYFFQPASTDGHSRILPPDATIARIEKVPRYMLFKRNDGQTHIAFLAFFRT